MLPKSWTYKGGVQTRRLDARPTRLALLYEEYQNYEDPATWAPSPPNLQSMLNDGYSGFISGDLGLSWNDYIGIWHMKRTSHLLFFDGHVERKLPRDIDPYDPSRGEQIAGYQFNASARDLRPTAHHIADLIYEVLTGERGAFATRIAYITGTRAADGKERVVLQVSDSDGFNSQTIFSSNEPVLSPAWSPDGRRLAYVSFENRKPAIYVQEVYSGKREKIADFPGINGAPAWSPDGRELAITLSKDGNPDIHIMDVASRSLRAITRHPAIDTEPAWAPDGRSLVFTSDRGGAPQIYRVSASGGEPQRVTFDGKYNARASFSPDGKRLTMVTRDGGEFRIGVLDLATKAFRTVSDGNLDESPSFAPNGSMIIYAARAQGRDLLLESLDTAVQLCQFLGRLLQPVAG